MRAEEKVCATRKNYFSIFNYLAFICMKINEYPLILFIQDGASTCFLIFLPTLVMGNFMVLNLFLALLLNSFNSEELKNRKEVIFVICIVIVVIHRVDNNVFVSSSIGSWR